MSSLTLLWSKVMAAYHWVNYKPPVCWLRSAPEPTLHVQYIFNWASIFQVDLHCALHRVATSLSADTSTNWRQSLFLCCTASMEQATDGAEIAAINELVSSWSENISVSFRLRAPRYGPTLWCILGLLIGGCNTSASVTVTDSLTIQPRIYASILPAQLIAACSVT